MDLCDYSKGYIVVKGKVTVAGTVDANEKNKKLILKNNSSFIFAISKINSTFKDNSYNLDIVMPMCNFL